MPADGIGIHPHNCGLTSGPPLLAMLALALAFAFASVKKGHSRSKSDNLARAKTCPWFTLNCLSSCVAPGTTAARLQGLIGNMR